jgi:hypothetical protein
MTVVRLPVHGRWVWDARGDNRAVRVSAHLRENVVNLSVWRDKMCVGTVRLLPSEAASLVAGLTDGLAELADRPDETPQAGSTDTLHEMELRLTRLESRLAAPLWRTAATAAAARVTDAVRRLSAQPRS